MMTHSLKAIVCLIFLFAAFNLQAQATKVTSSLFSGTVVIGYIDNGAFVNLLGPNIKFAQGNLEASLGLLPSLKLKKDNNIPKNSFITPSLGFGATLERKRFVVQLPLYYSNKTATQNGRWNLGFGLGFNI